MTTILLKVMLLTQRTLDSSYPGVTQDTQRTPNTDNMGKLFPARRDDFPFRGTSRPAKREVVTLFAFLPACGSQAGLHRDSFLAKVPGHSPVLSSGNSHRRILAPRYSDIKCRNLTLGPR
jgi:hypothetical protein